jgi:hypothetical protein
MAHCELWRFPVWAMTYIEPALLCLVSFVLPMLNTSSRAYALARHGFGQWFWITLVIAGVAGLLLARTFLSFADWPTLGLVFHAQWAVLIGMCRAFSRVFGYWPRDTYLRGWDELPRSTPDRLFGFVASTAMLACAVVVLYASRIWE